VIQNIKKKKASVKNGEKIIGEGRLAEFWPITESFSDFVKMVPLLCCAALLAGTAALGVRAPLSRRSSSLKAVWSDSRAVR
jgi:hypothetical protein